MLLRPSISIYLAELGIGKIGIVDFDRVDFSNLQRQIIHGTKDVDRSKAVSAKESLEEINPNTEIIGGAFESLELDEKKAIDQAVRSAAIV